MTETLLDALRHGHDFGLWQRDDGRYRIWLPRRLVLARLAFCKVWHPKPRRLARLRALYWWLLRNYETEICGRCGHPVGLVFHVPDELWEKFSGYENAARSPGGEAGAGCLCVQCVDDLYSAAAPRGMTGFLRWTCATDDSVMRG